MKTFILVQHMIYESEYWLPDFYEADSIQDVIQHMLDEYNRECKSDAESVGDPAEPAITKVAHFSEVDVDYEPTRWCFSLDDCVYWKACLLEDIPVTQIKK